MPWLGPQTVDGKWGRRRRAGRAWRLPGPGCSAGRHRTGRDHPSSRRLRRSTPKRASPFSYPPITDLQGSGAQHVDMNSLTPTQRDRGLQRLPFAAAAGASVAVLGVSYVAAASYAGTSSSASSTALNSSSSSSTDSSSTTSASPSATASSDSLPSATAAPTTAGNGSGTVTSGGS